MPVSEHHVIRDGMQVIGSDGGMIGEVDGTEATRIKLKRGPGGGPHHFIPLTWVARVDEHVHLDRSAALAREGWVAEGAAGAGIGAAGAAGAAGVGAAGLGRDDPARRPSAYGVKEGPVGSQRRALPWLLLAAAVVLLTVFLMRSCDGPTDPSEPQTFDPREKGVVNTGAVLPQPSGPPVGSAGGGPVAANIRTYLAGTDTAPRTFVFERLHFETARADIRPQDQAEVADIARVLVAYPTARIRVVGYADARGDAATNQQLGQQRAEAVAVALAAQGVARERVEAASGGEADPAASNTTTPGQAENRRTEIVILTR